MAQHKFLGLMMGLALATWSLTALTQPAEAAPIYGAPTDLGTLGGASSAAVAINEVGQVAGYSKISTGDQHAFRWDSGGGMVDLGTLGGAWSNAFAINESGTVLGQSITGSGVQRDFVWDDVNGMVDPGSLGGAGTTDLAAINDSGVVAGTSTYSGTLTHAFVWDSVGGMVDIGTLGGTTSGAMGINAAGDVVGWSRLAGDTEAHAFVWNSVDGMVDIGAPGINSEAWVINDFGVVGGRWYPSGSTRLFSWNSTDGMVDAGAAATSWIGNIAGISDDGEIAGFGFDMYTQAHGFVTNADDGYAEIDAGVPLSVASGVNASGQVAGTGITLDYSVGTPFVYVRGHGARILPAGAYGGGASAIADSGTVAGLMYVGGLLDGHAVIWEASTAPTVSLGSARVVEGNSGTRTALFAVTLSDPTATEITVPYSVGASTNQNAATATTDFRAKSGTIKFNPSTTVTTRYISVVVPADTTPETDETFVVALGTPSGGGYSLGVSVVTATIVDDELVSTPSVSVGDVSIWEGDTGSKNYAKVYVTLDAPAATTAVVTVTVSGGTATAPDDFKAITKTVTFAPGQYKKPLSILVKPDVVSEGDETVLVTLSNPSGVSLGKSVGTVTILSED
jgi:probable HAF family extracellular repeat protein